MPSMGHGSDGNADPAHGGLGHYKGKVNFTMKGDWTVTVKVLKNGSEVTTPIVFARQVN